LKAEEIKKKEKKGTLMQNIIGRKIWLRASIIRMYKYSLISSVTRYGNVVFFAYPCLSFSLSLSLTLCLFLLLNYILCDLYRYVYEGKKKLFQQDIKDTKKKWRKHKKKIYEYQDTKENKIRFGFWVDFLNFFF
jgi:hypothetical protein